MTTFAELDVDDDWPCAHCREPSRACGCIDAMSCPDCGEFWEHCACERELDVEVHT